MSMDTSESLTTTRRLSSNSEHATEESTCFDELAGGVRAMGESFAAMHQHFQQLQTVNDSLIEFNNSFSAFLFGLASSTSALRWPQAPTKESFEQFKSKVIDAEQSASDSAAQEQSHKQPQQTAQQQHQHQQHQHQQQHRHHQSKDVARTRVNRRQNMPTPYKKSSSKINLQNIAPRLPIQFRDDNERMKILEKVLSILKNTTNGMNIREIATATITPQHKITECLNVLVHSKDVTKYNQSGVSLYKLATPGETALGIKRP